VNGESPQSCKHGRSYCQGGKTFLTIGNFKVCPHAEQTKALLCELYGLRRQIHSNVFRSIPCELETIRAYTTPDFQDILPRNAVNRATVVRASRDRYTSSGNVFEIPPAVLFRR